MARGFLPTPTVAVLAVNDNASAGRKEYCNMNGSNFMQGWLTLVGSLAIIALILTAFGIMLGIVKPVDSMKHIGAIGGIVIVLILVPGILVGVWSAMSLWQQIALLAIGVCVIQWIRPRRRTRKKER
jgi:hypothetical protein